MSAPLLINIVKRSACYEGLNPEDKKALACVRWGCTVHDKNLAMAVKEVHRVWGDKYAIRLISGKAAHDAQHAIRAMINLSYVREAVWNLGDKKSTKHVDLLSEQLNSVLRASKLQGKILRPDMTGEEMLAGVDATLMAAE